MDFHSLARRELQCLCKKNKIPANMTNLAMADALAALQHVEGVEELMNLQSPARVTAPIAPTGSRTSARRKPTREVEVAEPLTQARVSRARTAGYGDQENKNANVPKTPAIPSTRRRAPVASACQKLDAQMQEDEEIVAQKMPETPAVTSSRRKAPVASASVQKVYSTRRSVKLLEATMAELSLDNGGKSKAVETVLSKKLAEDCSEVPDVVDEVEEMKDAIGSDVSQTQESDEKLDESNVHEAVEKNGADDVSVTELSSEANKLEVVAEVLGEGLEKESSECAEENMVSQDSDEHGELVSDEEGGDGSKVTDQNPSDELVLPKDSVLKSDCTIEEEKDDGSKVAIDEFVQDLALPVDMEDSDPESDSSTEGENDNNDSKVSDMDDSDSKSDCAIEDGNKVTDDEVVRALGLPFAMEDSDSDCSVEDEKDTDSKVLDKKAVQDADQSQVLPCNKETAEVEQSLGLPEDSDSDSNFSIEEERDGDMKPVEDEDEDESPVLPGDDANKVFDDADLPVEDSDSEFAEEKDDDSMVSDKKPVDNAELSPVFEDKVDSKIVSEKEGSDSEKLNLPPKTPSSVKQTPSRSQLSGDDQVTAATPLKPLADEVQQLPYQFPRPSKSTPMKPSSQMIPLVSDDKENIESNAANKVKVKAKNNIGDPCNLSIRQLQKKIKQLTLDMNGGEKKNAMQQCDKARTALQTLPENQMVAAEPEKN